MSVTGVARPPTADARDATTTAVLDAALRQFELFGIARSTVEDIAKRAGVARVTIYRRFPSKERLIEAVIQRELGRFLTELDEVVQPIDDREERIVEGFAFTLEAGRSHVLLQRMLESEPDTLLPFLTTEGAPVVASARDHLAAHLARERDERRDAGELATVAEIVVRLILSFLLMPDAPVDLDDRDETRRFARAYVGPILRGGSPRAGG